MIGTHMGQVTPQSLPMPGHDVHRYAQRPALAQPRTEGCLGSPALGPDDRTGAHQRDDGRHRNEPGPAAGVDQPNVTFDGILTFDRVVGRRPHLAMENLAGAQPHAPLTTSIDQSRPGRLDDEQLERLVAHLASDVRPHAVERLEPGIVGGTVRDRIHIGGIPSVRPRQTPAAVSDRSGDGGPVLTAR